MDCKGGSKMNIEALSVNLKPSDLASNGSFELQKNWARKLTGDGVKNLVNTCITKKQ